MRLEHPYLAEQEVHGASDHRGQFIEGKVHEVYLALGDEPETPTVNRQICFERVEQDGTGCDANNAADSELDQLNEERSRNSPVFNGYVDPEWQSPSLGTSLRSGQAAPYLVSRNLQVSNV